VRKKAIFWLAIVGLLFASQSLFAYTQEEQETFDNEPPVVKDLLERASKLLNDERDSDNPWKAANLYCESARYGSAEAVYRLGMLYAFGRGVPANRDYAANLFGIASTMGILKHKKCLKQSKLKPMSRLPVF
jgi:TPR repeat protein